MSQRFIVGDAIDVLGGLGRASVELCCTSPPFLGLRDYLDDEREVGTEETPGEYLDHLLAVVAALAPVLTLDGSLAWELGDTFADSGGAGGDYGPGGNREGQPRWKQRRPEQGERRTVSDGNRPGGHHSGGNGWPLGKSLCLIPQLFAASLAYGRNMLTGEESPAGRWRIRNFICWARTNPTPGAVGDKLRTGTSYITVACRERQRYWDPTAVANEGDDGRFVPALDWIHPEFTWVLPNSSGPRSPVYNPEREHEHFAVWPEELARRLILAMCPPGGTVLDPFCGTATTLAAAQGVGRQGIGIDLDPRNEELAREKVGMYLEVP